MLKYGATAGLFCVAFVTCLYYYSPRLLVEGYENINWLFIFAAMITASLAYLKQEKFATTQSLLKINFQTFAVAYLCKYVLIISLFYMDESLMDMVREIQLKFYLAQRDQNLPEEIFQQQLAQFQQMQKDSPIFDLLGLIIHFLMGFILSLLLAFIMKKEELD
jgi:Protein of unknown function (DUF4199)